MTVAAVVHGPSAGGSLGTGDVTTTEILDDTITTDDIHDVAEADLAFTDVTTANATTTKHGLLLKATAPASGLLSVVGIGNGETSYTNKALFDTTNPAALGVASPGTSLVAARRDHVHDAPASGTDITGMSALAAGDFKPLTDQIPIYDASAAANRKTSFLNMMGGRGYAVMAEECWNAAGLTSGMGSSVNGGGTLANDVAEAAHPGTFLASATSANDFAILDSAYANAIKWGAGKWRFLAIVQTPSSLSDGTHTYEIRAGFNDGGAGNGNDMVMFFYSHGTVSGNWAMVTRDNAGSTTTTDSGTAVATSTWYALEGETNADQTAVQFYINGVAAGAAVTAGLGTAGNGTKLHFSFMKTLGTGARTMKIDFLGCYFEPTTAR
jgi:hypothetical protein